jgi:transposase
MRHYGIGPLTSITILAELGDTRRFSSSREAVRYAGLDITVHQSDARRAPGHLSRQGPPGAALGALRGRAMRPPHRLTGPRLRRRGGRAARRQPRLPRRCAQAAQARYHTLRELGEGAMAPA